MELYKYSTSEHVNKLLRHGSVRIGTLYDFRDAEKYGNQIGDAAEGRIPMAGTLTNVTSQTIERHPILGRLVHLGEGSKIGFLTLENCSFHTENLYIFSASEGFSHKALLSWHNDLFSRYDACYRILSGRLFFRTVSRAIADRAEFLGFGPVHYYDEDFPIDIRSPLAHLHPGQLKGGKTYAHQTEIRAFWRPLDQAEIAPFCIDVPDIMKYCVLHRTL